MHVLVVTNDFPPRIGGIEHYVAGLIGHLPAGTTATVFASRHADAAAFDRTFRFPVIRGAAYPMLPTPRVRRAVIDLARAERPDVVMFGASLPLALLGGAIRKAVGVPIVACTHGAEGAAASVPGGRALVRRIARHATMLTAVSAWGERALRRAVGSRPRIALLPSGVDVARFHAGVDGRAERRRIGGDPLIVTLSRLVPRKGHDQTIRALPAIAREFPAVRLVIGGTGPDRGRLARLARDLGVADRVQFAGRLAEDAVPAFLAAGDVFAMPCRSRWFGLDVEALGAVYLQAAAVGRPVITGRTGGAAEAVIDGDTGLAVDGTSVPAVEGALRRLLGSPEDRARMGRAGAERIQRELTWTRLAGRLHALLVEAASA